ncbi:putative dehydrogenase [Arcticibacter pallidicorallinus]|uniref:Putative dehydrogenase n=1 Tax=Arcticibacter pallidicorallinus TaxID=1259464 RepID=A0A2T0UC69_9SPHI|nr:Gfo/Idh/MocA family oxidoreductase [Arcticibacter pallidicorallinus]PRY55509.1 putative dehydrogenase [Arcticibacter pallidicorallinus]
MQTLNIGILGCGRMGKIRAASTQASGHRVVAVSDTDANRLREIKEVYPDVHTYPSLEKFPTEKIDALFICSPPCHHLTHIEFAIENNLPFLIEKPLSLNSDGLENLLQKINEKRLINAVGYMNRYRASIKHVKDVACLGISSYWINKMYQVPWWANQSESGGPLNEQATHLLDLNRYIMGEVREVYATGADNELSFATSISIALKFKSGIVGNILYSCDASAKNIGLDLYTKENKVSLTGWDFNLTSPDDLSLPMLSGQDIFDIETRSFLNAVINNDPSSILCNVEEAKKTQELVDAVNLSLKLNNPIPL